MRQIVLLLSNARLERDAVSFLHWLLITQLPERFDFVIAELITTHSPLIMAVGEITIFLEALYVRSAVRGAHN